MKLWEKTKEFAKTNKGKIILIGGTVLVIVGGAVVFKKVIGPAVAKRLAKALGAALGVTGITCMGSGEETDSELIKKTAWETAVDNAHDLPVCGKLIERWQECEDLETAIVAGDLTVNDLGRIGENFIQEGMDPDTPIDVVIDFFKNEDQSKEESG